MFQKARETNYLESTSLVVQAFKWRKPLMIVTCVAALCSFIFSGPAFITPKYKSSVIFFPPSTNSISKALLEENSSDKQDILAFGEEEQAEQMLQILNSDEIREAIVLKYGLMQHYGIDPSEEFPMTRLAEEYRDNINFSRTEFMSVRIDVLDKDAQMAANIANDIATLMDSMKNHIQRERATEALKIVEATYLSKLSEMKIKEDSLSGLRRLGVMDYTTQSTIWNEEYAKSYAAYNNDKAMLIVLERHHKDGTPDTAIVNTKARIEGAASRMRSLQQKLDVLARYGGASVSLSEELEIDRKDIARLRERFEKLKVDANQNLSHKFVVSKAVKAERKSTPVRWLIVTVSTIGFFFLAFVTLLAVDRLKEINYKL